jgi:hypothetical protein
MPIVRKKSGVTSRRLTLRSAPSSDCPSGMTGQMPPRITIGR